MIAAMLVIHCNECDSTTPKEHDRFPQPWIAVYSEDDGGRTRRPASPVHDLAERLAGHYCSPLCLTAAVGRLLG